MDVIQAGHLDYQIGLHTNDEIGQLSKAIDEMTEQLQKTTSNQPA